MELSDKIEINAPRERVFAALNDEEILRQAIPGCETIESTGENAYTATVSQKIGPLKTRFKGAVRLTDIVSPESYTLEGSGKAGPAGHVKVRAAVRLEDTDNNGTLLNYDVHADIGGKLAQLGGHLVESTSKKLSAEFFGRLENLITQDEVSNAPPVNASSIERSDQNTKLLWFVGAACAVGVLLWLVL